MKFINTILVITAIFLIGGCEITSPWEKKHEITSPKSHLSMKNADGTDAFERPTTEDLYKQMRYMNYQDPLSETFADYETAYTRTPDNRIIAKNYATALRLAGFSDRALVVLSALPSDDTDVEAMTEMAAIEFNRGRYDHAIDLCGRVLRIHPNNMKAVFLMATARSKSGDFEGAGAYFKQAYTLLSRYPDARPAVLNNYAVYLVAYGRVDQARTIIMKLSEEYPTEPAILDNLSVLMF